MSDEMQCPTCGARQSLALECRRCKCDLSLVMAVESQEQELHATCLRALRADRHDDALRAARRRWELSPDLEAARLLTVCFLLLGQYPSALQVFDATRTLRDIR